MFLAGACDNHCLARSFYPVRVVCPEHPLGPGVSGAPSQLGLVRSSFVRR